MLAEGDPSGREGGRQWRRESVRGRERWEAESSGGGIRLLHARILHFIAALTPLCDVCRQDSVALWEVGV